MMVTATDLIQQKPDLTVSAYLIYNDGSLSAFDVLNNKTVALWNVVAGGGDALKPSEKTTIRLSGNLEDLNIQIRNGRNLAVDTTITHSDKEVEYVVNNTGCDEVSIDIVRGNKPVYSNAIPFHCGE